MRILRRVVVSLLALIALLWVGLSVYAYWPGPAEVPARTLASADDRFVTVDGMELRYRTFGTPAADKPNLVLVHGFANSLQSFRLLAPLLAERFYVVTVDAPGFGLSAKPAHHDYGNSSQAKVIADFAAALGFQHYVIGGHSMGGTLSLYVATSDPHVTGAVLMNPGVITTGVPPITEYLVFPFPRLMAKTFGAREFRERFMRQSFIDQSIVTEQVMTDMMLAPRSEGYLTGTTEMMSHYDTGDEADVARRVKVPTLIVWGMQDKSKKPGELQSVQALIPGSKIAPVEGSGHYVQEEQPAAVAAAMIAAASAWL